MPTFARTIPLLVYEDIPAAHDFLVNAFGFEPGGVDCDAEGQPVHAEVRVGDTTIWLHRVTDQHGMASPRTLGVAESGLVVHVDDVDAHFQRAKDAGAQIEREPADMFYAFSLGSEPA